MALDNPRTPVPTLHRLVREGARAAAVMPINPVVTWPNHTMYVTGVTPAKHQVMFNGLLTRDASGLPKIEPWRPKREMVKAPTVYDAAFAAGLTTAQVDWVAIHEPQTITWAFAERPSPGGASKPRWSRPSWSRLATSRRSTRTRPRPGAIRCGPMRRCTSWSVTSRTCCCSTCSRSTARITRMAPARSRRPRPWRFSMPRSPGSWRRSIAAVWPPRPRSSCSPTMGFAPRAGPSTPTSR